MRKRGRRRNVKARGVQAQGGAHAEGGARAQGRARAQDGV
jgi:hypothetical protein